MERKVALETLGFTATETPDEDEVRRAFKKVALSTHPDKGGDPEKFNDVKTAMETLLSPPPPEAAHVIEKTWHRYVSGETDLSNLLKKYFNPNFTVREEKVVAITISDYYNKVPVSVDGYGKFVFDHLGENEVDEYIITPYLINDDHFSVVDNLDISQKVECSLSILLFGGEIVYRDLSGKKMKAGPIKSSKKIMGRKITIRGRGLTSEDRVGDMILKLIPNFDNTDFKRVVENKKLLTEIFK